MTDAQIQDRIGKHPMMCKSWIVAAPLKHDGGVVYLSHISDGDERVGMVHIYIWDKSDMGSPDSVRDATIKLLHEHRIDRLLGEINTDNALAINLARRVGFHEIGVVRRRRGESGLVRDVLLMDALPEDLCHG